MSDNLVGMKLLVTGGHGMLGRDVDAVLSGAGVDVTLAGRAQLDVTSAPGCLAAVAGYDIVVNAAAWTAVDDAEEHEGAAFAVNGTGAANLARACDAHGTRLVHISTDYVFDGDATTPYPEGWPQAPRSAYGRTKAAGEWAVRALCAESWVVRTAWLYGEHGPNFVKTMARLASERETVSVVDDQHGQPTWTVDVAEAVARLVGVGGKPAPFGTYHATSSGDTTWFGLAREIFRLLGLDPSRVLPTTSEAFVRPAPRPSWSVLGHDAWGRAGLAALPTWEDALGRSVEQVVGVHA